MKPIALAKQRLSGVLDDGARERLVRGMLAHVAQTAKRARGVDRVCIVAPAPEGLSEFAPVIADPGGGLNVALGAALREAVACGARRVVFIAADLPLLGVADVETLAAAPESSVTIAPDRDGAGTNALSLPLPAARAFAFAFGPGSFALHLNEANRLGLGAEIVRSTGLAVDIDLPADLPDAAAFLAKPAP